MPVYNEERYLPEALDSLLAQDFKDFELIILDNASEDRTQKIYLEYASRDPRIRYYRNETHIGAIENFNRAFKMSHGEHFMWAAGHDLWDRRFISSCLEVLAQDPSVVLCSSRAIRIDAKGNYLGFVAEQIDTRGLGPSSRFKMVLWGKSFAPLIYGLIRSDALRQTHLFRNVIGADVVLLTELSLLGSFARIPEPLFYWRKLREREYESPTQWVTRQLGRKNRGMFIEYCRWANGLLRVVTRGRISCSSKVVLMLNAILWTALKYSTASYYMLSTHRSIARARAIYDVIYDKIFSYAFNFKD